MNSICSAQPSTLQSFLLNIAQCDESFEHGASMGRETTSLNLAKLRGVTFVNQYVVIKYLGKGANGRVFLCLDMCDNRLYAVKVGKSHDLSFPQMLFMHHTAQCYC